MRFSLRDLLIGITIVCVLFALTMPFFEAMREASRRNSCSDNLKQISLAIHQYHSAHDVCPAAMFGTEANEHRLSGLIALTPFLDAKLYWVNVSTPQTFGGVAFPPMGTVPWDLRYPPWNEELAMFRCPSDRNRRGQLGRTNYAFCVGDQIEGLYDCEVNDETRGVFAPNIRLSLDDITDGLSNTVMMAEIATKQGRVVQGQFAVQQLACLAESPEICRDLLDEEHPEVYPADVKLSMLGRGGAFADGAGGYSMFHTILPPNAPSCAIDGQDPLEGVFSAGSYHQGGVHILMGDGAVIFVTNTIEAGDPSSPAPYGTNIQGRGARSPYGLWGALGTRSSAEAIDECGCH
ncbi:MAG: DUF1559 domain-containing protein [Planctomycetota bacterium]